MSATEVIEEIKKLTPEERAEVCDFVNGVEKTESMEDAADESIQYASDEAFEEALEHVMTHHAPLMKKLAE